jgi:hypothetical protein
MCDVAGWPVGAGAVVCAKAVPTPTAEQRSIALTSDFIVNSVSMMSSQPLGRSYHCLRSSFAEYVTARACVARIAGVFIATPSDGRSLMSALPPKADIQPLRVAYLSDLIKRQSSMPPWFGHRAGNCHSACLQARRRDFELTWTLLLLELSFLKIAFARFRVMRQNQPIIPCASVQ